MNKPITIIIAEDNQLMRATLKMVISGMEEILLVAEARNGEEIILLADQHKPAIILMDINMKPVNGFEASRKILKANPSIRIIGLSMHKKAAYAKNMMQIGAYGYVTKSSPHNEIMEAIRKVAEGQKHIDKSLEGQVDF